MEKNNIDKFEISDNQPFIQKNNFFLEEEASVSLSQYNTEPARRLNDYDFNLLKEDAYKDVADDLFKLEYKIAKTEEELRDIDSQIQASIDIQDYYLEQELINRKQILQEDLESLLAIYNDKSFSAKISEKISLMLGAKTKSIFKNFQNKLSNTSEIILANMPKSVSSIFELKKALNKLENINRSVDELITMNIPYGENVDKYTQLSKFIIKANSIQAEISKHLKK